MKILIGYDGSECSDAALDDLKAAGLPPELEAHVMSIVETWLPPPPDGMTVSEYAKILQTHPQPFKAWVTNAAEITVAEASATAAAERVRWMFPKWKVTSEGNYGSPSWELLAKASEIKADLIVVGSHGRSAVGRFWLGSVSQKVVTEADCTVRVARGRIDIDPSRARIVIGYDGLGGANAAVDCVAARYWPNESEVKLVSVTDLPFADTVESLAPSISQFGEGGWMMELAVNAVQKLREAGLSVEFVGKAGNPKKVLVNVAEEWGADSIFVGANRFGTRVERFLLGSVSSAIAARAHCSVEVVRTYSA